MHEFISPLNQTLQLQSQITIIGHDLKKERFLSVDPLKQFLA